MRYDIEAAVEGDWNPYGSILLPAGKPPKNKVLASALLALGLCSPRTGDTVEWREEGFIVVAEDGELLVRGFASARPSSTAGHTKP